MPANWREAALDGLCLGLFMVSACVFGSLVFHPDSWLHQALGSDAARRVVMGAIMGSTAVALIYSPIGRRSGAHMNPATTLTFLALRRIAPQQAVSYIVAQFLGGALGVGVSALVLGPWLSHRQVHYVATRPGPAGIPAAFAAEVVIAIIMMGSVLWMTSNTRRARFTGFVAGALVWTFIAVESPVSGMSLNPARSAASAVVARDFGALWIYLLAPCLGMLAAAGLHRQVRGSSGCAKLMHQEPCHFCDHRARRAAACSHEPAIDGNLRVG